MGRENERRESDRKDLVEMSLHFVGYDGNLSLLKKETYNILSSHNLTVTTKSLLDINQNSSKQHHRTAKNTKHSSSTRNQAPKSSNYSRSLSYAFASHVGSCCSLARSSIHTGGRSRA